MNFIAWIILIGLVFFIGGLLFVSIKPKKIADTIKRDIEKILAAGFVLLFIAAFANGAGLEFDTVGAWFSYLIMWWLLYLYVKKKDE